MNIKRFFGKNSKDALTMVRNALGDDAVILSNRAVNGGNEIMAFKEEEINALIDDEMNTSSDFAQNVEFNTEAFEAAQESPQVHESQFGAVAAEKPDYLRPDMTRANAKPQAAPAQPSLAATQPNAPTFAPTHSSTPNTPVSNVSPMNDALRELDAQSFQQHVETMNQVPSAAAQAPTQTPEAAVSKAPVQAATFESIADENIQSVVSNAPNQKAAQDTIQMAAMLKEMSSMRRDIESQLTTFKQTELKPLESLPRNANKKATEQTSANPSQTVENTPAVAEKSETKLPAVKTVASAPVPAAKPVVEEKPQPSPQMLEMLSEMRDMRSAFESQLTSMNWSNIAQRDPIKAEMLNMLLSAGFSASLSRQMAEKIPATIQGEQTTVESAREWVKSILELNLKTIDHENELFDEGGVFALIGPTGVGKTTTTAKLAARYVMKHGTENLGIITTDAYRVGGHEQLRIYGKILGVMVHAVKDETDLKIALNELKNKHTILIDTVGVSQKDRMVAEQIAMLSNTQRPIKKLLCLNATNTGETLTDVVRAYKGRGLDGCILTKIDEAATIGNALDVAIRSKLKLYYATNGQRVPEDIEYSDKKALVEQAFVRNEETQAPYEFLEEELPFIMGNMAQNHETSDAGAVEHA